MAGLTRLLYFVIGVSLSGTLPVNAAPQDSAGLCEIVAERVARETGVPVSVLKAISLTETGRKTKGAFRPWPWTVNMEGAGHWFDNRDQALAYVFKEYKRGARSFDVGCFQINYKWHGQNFSSIEEMFDPLANGRYAAQFLSDLYRETGDWKKAAGAFHSRTREHAERYSDRFASLRQRFLPEDKGGAPVRNTTRMFDVSEIGRTQNNSDIPEIPDIVLAQQQGRREVTRQNNYPLLVRQEGATPSLGRASGASLFAAALSKGEGS